MSESGQPKDDASDQPKPGRKNKEDLKQLMAQMPKNYRPGEVDWGPPLGKEIW